MANHTDPSLAGCEQGHPPPPQADSTPCPYQAALEEEQINLFDYWDVVRRRWRQIATCVTLGTLSAVLYALLATPIYRAQALIAPKEQRHAGGASAALAALGGFGQDIAGSLGISFGSADSKRLEALLKSHRLAKRVLAKHDLLPVLFPDKWDASAGKWNVTDADDVPDYWDAREQLDGMYAVKFDARDGVLSVSLELHDLDQARSILRNFLDELAITMQEDELRRIKANQEFTEAQLGMSTDPAIVAKLQRMLSDLVEQAMMAQNVENFAYEVIDPPIVSNKRVWPKRKLVVAFGLAGSTAFGVFLSFFAEWLRNSRRRNNAVA